MVNDKLPVCRAVKQACERHFRDLVAGHERGIIWHPEKGLFAIQFFNLLRHSKGEWAGQPVSLAPWQQFIVASVFGWKRADGTRRFRTVYEELPRKNGKALDVNTPVATPDGWKRHGDLRPGDVVFDPQGRQIAVQAVTGHYSGHCYNVAFSDGTSIVAHERHEWRTNRTWFTGRQKGSRQPPPLVETRQIAQTVRLPQRAARGRYPHAAEYVHGIWCTAPLETAETPLPVPPYTLGAWLGDGHALGPRLTCHDAEIIAAIASEDVPVRKTAGSGVYSLASPSVYKGRWRASIGLHAGLKALRVLGDKAVPTLYLRSSVAQRRELLAGIVDTDGHVTRRGQCEVVLTNHKLFLGVVELARSLGFKPTVVEDRATLDGRDIGPRYRMQFWPAFVDLPLRVTRKRDRLRHVPSGRSRTRMIVSCDAVGERLVNCITVDGGMYLAGEAMVPTHNSTLCAGIGIYGLVADREPGAEVYAAATRKDQARLIFDEARRMVRSSPPLRGKVGIYKLNLSVDATASKFEPLSADDRTLDGLNPSVILIDELHKHKSRAVLDVLDTALGARRQPLLWIITTAGDDSPESVYAQENDYAIKVLEQAVEDDSAFVFIATIDADDAWDDPRAWAKANPNLGISVKLDDLKRQALKARNSPGALVEFKRLRLNQRTAAAGRFVDAEVWRRNTLCPAGVHPGVYRGELEQRLRGRRFFGALDLSSKVDLSAWIRLFPPLDADDRWHVLARLWMPADTVAEKSDRDQVQYRRWIDEGWIEVTAGNVIDHGEIGIAVEQDCRGGSPASIAYDPWNATQLAVGLAGQGLPMIEFIQGIRSYTAPTKEFEAWLLQAKLDHGSHPVLAWMASNLAVQRDKNENMMPTKRMSRGRIDGLTALIMAIGRWMADPGPSRYEDPNERMLFV